jgi:ketosteroid isomerase-like protein
MAVLDELLTDDFLMLYGNQNDAEAVRGRERHKEFVDRHARAFVDDKWTIEALVADEQTVACRWRIEATHAETGSRIDVRAADFYTARNGRLAELRRFLDFRSFEAQFKV